MSNLYLTKEEFDKLNRQLQDPETHRRINDFFRNINSSIQSHETEHGVVITSDDLDFEQICTRIAARQV